MHETVFIFFNIEMVMFENLQELSNPFYIKPKQYYYIFINILFTWAQ